MKKIYIFFLSGMLLFAAGGCKEKLPPPDPAKEAYLQTLVRCAKCRKSSKVGEYERINQVLGRCPFCKKVVAVMPKKSKRQ